MIKSNSQALKGTLMSNAKESVFKFCVIFSCFVLQVINLEVYSFGMVNAFFP